MKKVVGAAALFMSLTFLSAMEEVQEKPSKIINITEELITQYKDGGFTDFIATKKIQKCLLNGGSWVPGFDTLVKKWEGVDPEDARTFLNRIFDKETEFKDVVETFAGNKDNIAYIQSIFDKLSEEDIKSKSNGKIVEAIRNTQHPQVKVSRNINIKAGQEEYIPDKIFFQYAACNLMTLYAFDKLTATSSSPRGLRRKNSKTSLQEEPCV